jgi:hypothetical protein
MYDYLTSDEFGRRVRAIVESLKLRLGVRCVLLVVVGRLGGLSPLEPPMHIGCGRVPPLAHPVLETR